MRQKALLKRLPVGRLPVSLIAGSRFLIMNISGTRSHNRRGFNSCVTSTGPFYTESKNRSHCYVPLKVHKHEIILNFFLTKIKSLYSPGKFSKKISLLFLRFSPEFRSSNIFAVTEHTRNQIFLKRYPKKFFFKMFTWVLYRTSGVIFSFIDYCTAIGDT